MCFNFEEDINLSKDFNNYPIYSKIYSVFLYPAIENVFHAKNSIIINLIKLNQGANTYLNLYLHKIYV